MHPREKAAQNGQRKYDGAPCKHCNGTERWTINAACTACSGERSREYAKTRREEIKRLLRGES